MTKKTKCILLTGIILLSQFQPVFAITKEEIKEKNSELYQAGNQSVYGKNLNQEELNEIAQAAADFTSNSITSDMTQTEKVRAVHDYLVNTCEYAADWSKNRANTAWGALVYHEAQCSGYARAFKVLCDAIDIECYYVHADADAINPSHQWNIVKVNGVWYHIDVQCNDTSGFDAYYLTTDYLMSYDTTQFPIVGVREDSENGGIWKQNEIGWWYENEEGIYPVNQWEIIDGKWYYFDGKGYMLADTITPDGYYVDENGQKADWMEFFR